METVQITALISMQACTHLNLLASSSGEREAEPKKMTPTTAKM